MLVIECVSESIFRYFCKDTFTWTLSLPLLMAMYLELLLDWPRAIEKAPLTAIQKACCLGSLRAIGLGSVLAVYYMM